MNSVATAYWEARARQFAHRGGGLRAVCSYGMPWFYNGYIDLVQRRALSRWLRVPPGTAILEIGCGVGRWSRRLARRGADVTAFDLSPAMIAEARRRTSRAGLESRCHFDVGDAADLALDRRFDCILCVTVLQHILDTARLERTVERMARHLAPNGRIVLLEVAPSSDVDRCNTSTFVGRREEDYRDLFARAGLRCIEVRGVDPCPLKTWLLPSYAGLPRVLRAAALFGVTAVTLPFDLIVSGLLTGRSWHKVFVLRHR